MERWSVTESSSAERSAVTDLQEGRASPANGDSSILPIVTSQRDRFRQRNAELEEVRLALNHRA